LRTEIASVRQDIRQELVQLREERQSLQSELEQSREDRERLKSLLGAVPDTVERQMQDRANEIVNAVGARCNQDLTNRHTELAGLSQHIESTGAKAEERLAAFFSECERALQDQVEANVHTSEALKVQIRESVQSIGAQVQDANALRDSMHQQLEKISADFVATAGKRPR
jgi:uncharacterized membrane-anchored protein YjiN (DUF445 family)